MSSRDRDRDVNGYDCRDYDVGDVSDGHVSSCACRDCDAYVNI